MPKMPPHSAGSVRSADPPPVWMAAREKAIERVRTMAEAASPGTGCGGGLLGHRSSPRHTAAGCWAATNCSPCPPPERDRSEESITKRMLISLI